jgi:hypothetical protein
MTAIARSAPILRPAAALPQITTPAHLVRTHRREATSQ